MCLLTKDMNMNNQIANVTNKFNSSKVSYLQSASINKFIKYSKILIKLIIIGASVHYLKKLENIILIRLVIISASVCYLKRLKNIYDEKYYEKKLSEVCNAYGCRLSDIYILTKECAKSVIEMDNKHGYGALKHSIIDDSKGNKLFISRNNSIIDLYKSMALSNSNFQPKSKHFISLFCFTEKDKEFTSVKRKGCLIPEFNVVVIGCNDFVEAMEESAKDIYGEDAEFIRMYPKRFSKVYTKLMSDKNKYIENKKNEMRAKLGSKDIDESEIDTSKFDCTELSRHGYYSCVACRRGVLNPYFKYIYFRESKDE